ncbi:MAG: transporter substrate-binding domain-containing protein, partial [Erysipelotrichaceae bacterium]|nr:transporter substrate-binding domain-containing protein [Erysipelotrichaceae bacterium]
MKKIIRILLIAVMSMTLFACTGSKESQSITSIEDLRNRRVGIKQGTIYDGLTKRLFPDAQYFYYNNNTDLTAALKGHKIDGFVADDAIIDEIIRENPEVMKIGEHVTSFDVGLVFAKNDKGRELAEMMNVLIKELQDNGQLDILYQKWLNYDSDTKMFDT